MTGRVGFLQPGLVGIRRTAPAPATNAVGRIVALAAAYVIAARVGVELSLGAGPVSPIWSPAGIGVAALVLWGRSVVPGIAIGAFVAALMAGYTPVLATVIAAGTAAEALAARELLARVAFRPQLDRFADVLAFALGGCALPAAIAATFVSAAQLLSGALAPGAVAEPWIIAWAGDAIRILVVGGLVLTWFAPPATRMAAGSLEAVGGIVALTGLAATLFFDVLHLQASGQSVAFPIVPALVWVAFRVGPRGTTLAAALVSVIALAATQRGLGPFVGTTGEGSLMYVAIFLALIAVTGDAVAAVVAEREAGRRATVAASHEARAALARLQAIEVLGHLLAEHGPTPEALDTVAASLIDDFGYVYPTIYIGDASVIRLAAQRGYRQPIEEFDPSRGIIGEVMRSGTGVLVPHVSHDPDIAAAHPGVLSKIAVPLLAHGEFLGVLTVKSGSALDERDVSTVTVVADRVAAAIALARERAGLAARAEIFRRLAAFTRRITGVLAQDQLYRETVEAADAVVPADHILLTVFDRGSGEFVVRAEKGSPGAIGCIIRSGEGLTGRAIRDRVAVELEGYGKADFPASLRGTHLADEYAAALGIPLLGDDVVLGALTIARVDPARPFSDLELEAFELLARAITLAVSNASLHAEVAERAVRDALTGLHNRRYFDGAFTQLFAARRRLPEAERPALSAIMFDLDHFGRFNKEHGHQVGDEVLRAVGRILGRRLREGDLVARYGGEEFIAIVPGATADDARRIAEDVRLLLADTVVEGVTGEALTVTVSAGCATADPADDTGEALVRAADVGLIMAKRAGRNRVVSA